MKYYAPAVVTKLDVRGEPVFITMGPDRRNGTSKKIAEEEAEKIRARQGDEGYSVVIVSRTETPWELEEADPRWP